MKIIDNAKKHALPPCYALYDAPANALYLYADFRGLVIGLRAAFRRFDSQVATFFSSGDWCASLRKSAFTDSFLPSFTQL